MEIRGLSANERSPIRQAKSRPIRNDLELWLRAKLTLIRPEPKRGRMVELFRLRPQSYAAEVDPPGGILRLAELTVS